MDHLFKNISDGPLCYGDTSWTTSQNFLHMGGLTYAALASMVPNWERFGLRTKKWTRTSTALPTRPKENSNGFCATGDVMLGLLSFPCFYHGTGIGDDQYRGVTRLDGARGKKQVWRPMFEFEVFRNQIYCIEESTLILLGLFGAPIVIGHPENCAPLSLRPWTITHNLLYSKGYNFQKCFIRDLWNALWSGGPPGKTVVHLDHVENHWFRVRQMRRLPRTTFWNDVGSPVSENVH